MYNFILAYGKTILFFFLLFFSYTYEEVSPNRHLVVTWVGMIQFNGLNVVSILWKWCMTKI